MEKPKSLEKQQPFQADETQKAFKCAKYGDSDALEDALMHGVNPNARNKKGCTLLIQAIHANKPMCVRLVIGYGASLELPNNVGCTPLMWAAATKNLGLVVLMIESGCNLNVVDSCGFTALTHAASVGAMDCALALMDAGCQLLSKSQFGDNNDMAKNEKMRELLSARIKLHDDQYASIFEIFTLIENFPTVTIKEICDFLFP